MTAENRRTVAHKQRAQTTRTSKRSWSSPRGRARTDAIRTRAAARGIERALRVGPQEVQVAGPSYRPRRVARRRGAVPNRSRVISRPAAEAAERAKLQAALARAHAAARPEALGFLHIDGHVRVYAGTRDLPKTHIARMHLAGHATAETWVADADADPVLVVTAPRRPAWPASWCGCCPSCAPWLARTGGPPSSSTAAVSRRPPSRPSAPPCSTCSPTARDRSTGCPTPRSPWAAAPTPTARPTATGWPRPPSSCPCRTGPGPRPGNAGGLTGSVQRLSVSIQGSP